LTVNEIRRLWAEFNRPRPSKEAISEISPLMVEPVAGIHPKFF
jgi:hypothetical protein